MHGSRCFLIKVRKKSLRGQVGQVATSDGSMETWTIGRNLPACLSRSGLTSMEAQIIGNSFENLAHLPDPLRMQVHSYIMHAHNHTQHGGSGHSFAEGLCRVLADGWTQNPGHRLCTGPKYQWSVCRTCLLLLMVLPLAVPLEPPLQPLLQPNKHSPATALATTSSTATREGRRWSTSCRPREKYF